MSLFFLAWVFVAALTALLFFLATQDELMSELLYGPEIDEETGEPKRGIPDLTRDTEQARDAALVHRDDASAAADEARQAETNAQSSESAAAASASSAESDADRAETASSAATTGAEARAAVPFYATFADAESARTGGELAEGDLVQVGTDEAAAGLHTLRITQSNGFSVPQIFPSRGDGVVDVETYADLPSVPATRSGQQAAPKGERGGRFQAVPKPSDWSGGDGWKETDADNSAYGDLGGPYIWTRLGIEEGLQQKWFDIDYTASGIGTTTPGAEADQPARQANYGTFQKMVQAALDESAERAERIGLTLGRPFWMDMTDEGLDVQARQKVDGSYWPLVIGGRGPDESLIELGNEYVDAGTNILINVPDGTPLRFSGWGMRWNGYGYLSDETDAYLIAVHHGQGGGASHPGTKVDNHFKDFHVLGDWAIYALWLGVRGGTDYLRRVRLEGYRGALSSWALYDDGSGDQTVTDKRLVIEDFYCEGGIQADAPGNRHPGDQNGNTWYISDGVQIRARRGSFGENYRVTVKHNNVSHVSTQLPGENVFEDIDFGPGGEREVLRSSITRPTRLTSCTLAGLALVFNDLVLGPETRHRSGERLLRMELRNDEGIRPTVRQQAGSVLQNATIDFHKAGDVGGAFVQEAGALLEGPPARSPITAYSQGGTNLDLAGTVRTTQDVDGEWPGAHITAQTPSDEYLRLSLRTRPGFRLEGESSIAAIRIWSRVVEGGSISVDMDRPVFDSTGKILALSGFENADDAETLLAGERMRIRAPEVVDGFYPLLAGYDRHYAPPIVLTVDPNERSEVLPGRSSGALDLPGSRASVYDAPGGDYPGGIDGPFHEQTGGIVRLRAVGGDLDFSGAGDMPGVGVLAAGQVHSLLLDPLAYRTQSETEAGVASGNGTQSTFVLSFVRETEEGSVEVTDGSETFTEQADGSLAGSAGGTGSVDADRRGATVNFASAPADGAGIDASYQGRYYGIATLA